MLLEADAPDAPPPTQRSSLSELEAYLDEPAPPPTTDVLQWWGENEDRFPNVARMHGGSVLGVPRLLCHGGALL